MATLHDDIESTQSLLAPSTSSAPASARSDGGMEFVIQSMRIRNTDLISTDGSIVYEIRTPWNAAFKRGGASTIHRKEAGKHDVLVAEIEWHVLNKSLITMGGMTLEKSGFLKGGGWLPRRTITARDGCEYQWEYGLPPKLRAVVPTRQYHDDSIHPPIAEYSSANWFKRVRPSLIVRPRGLHILDEIVVSFFLVEHMRRSH